MIPVCFWIFDGKIIIVLCESISLYALEKFGRLQQKEFFSRCWIFSDRLRRSCRAEKHLIEVENVVVKMKMMECVENDGEQKM